jgi:hypothetical protein
MVLYSHARKHVRRIPVRSSEWFPPKSGILWWFNGILWDFNGIYSDLMGYMMVYPLVNQQFALENGPVIVDLPMKNDDCP